MSSQRRIRDTGLLVLMLAAALALALTRDSETLGTLGTKGALSSPPTLVDESPLQTARFIARLASTLEEREFAQAAVRVADEELDLAFTEAMRNVKQNPPVLSAEVRAIGAAVVANSARVKADQEDIEKLTEQLKLVSPARRDLLQEQLDVQRARLELEQDSLADSKQDLARAGGDPAMFIQRAFEEHKLSEQHATEITPVESTSNNAAANYAASNMVGQLTALYALAGGKISILRQAMYGASTRASALAMAHDSLERKLATQAQTVQVAKPQKTEQPAMTAKEIMLLEQQSSERRSLKELDQQMDYQRQLSTIYGGWIGLVTRHQERAQRGVMRSTLWILLIFLAIHFGDRFLQGFLSWLSKRRAGLGNLPAVAHFAMQASGVLLILAVIFGVPEQLPAAVFGVVGAGVTVASKDIVLGFIDSRVKGLISSDAKQAGAPG